MPETLTSIPEAPTGATRYVSEAVTPASRFERVVLSWNTHLPVAGVASFRIRVRAEGLRWSSWFTAGTWPPSVYRPRPRDPLYGSMEVDELRLRRPCTAVQHGVWLSGGARLPRKVFLTCSPSECRPDPCPPPETGLLKLPYFSQFSADDLPDESVREAGGCAPTSVAMVAAYHGVDVRPLDVARICHDPLHDIYGNWPYLACGASSLGLEAWVTRVAVWDDLAGWLRQGVPPILSIAWREGELPNAPIPSSRGHLLVVAGLGNAGVTCYDPAAKEAPVCYPWREFGKIFWGHGGVAIIIKRK